MKNRPAGMDYGTYKAMCAAKKETPLSEDQFKALPVDDGQEPDDDAGGEGGGDNGEGGGQPDDAGNGGGAPAKDDEEDPAEKGTKLGDLRKSMAAFDDVAGAAQAAVGGSRETYLTARFAAGTITKSERAELGRIMAGTAENPNVDAAGRPLRKSLESYLDPEDKEVVNAAPLLKSLMNGVQDRLDAIQSRADAGHESTRQLLLAEGQLLKGLCGAVLEMGAQNREQAKLIKSLQGRLATVETTPAAPRAVRSAGARGAAQPPINKSTTGARSNGGAGGAGGGDNLQKSQVVRAFHTLVKGASDGNDFATAERLSHECATYERNGFLSPGTKAAIQAVAS